MHRGFAPANSQIANQMQAPTLSMSSSIHSSIQLWAVIPVKPFGEGKSRLSTRLDPAGRAEVSRKLLTGVIQVVQASEVCTGILVISRDRAVLNFAEQLGAQTLLESLPNPEQDPLNGALTQARDEVMRQGADALIVLPADLPYITPADLLALYQAAVEEEGVVIAPSHDGGTNALVLRPPGCIHFDFGRQSCTNHQRRAVENGLPYTMFESTTLAFDLDQPTDLERWVAETHATNSSPQACL